LIQANGYGTGYAASVVRLAYNGSDRTTTNAFFLIALCQKKAPNTTLPTQREYF